MTLILTALFVCLLSSISLASDSEMLAIQKALNKVPKASLVNEGKKVFNRRCARCHGVPGRSKGFTSFSGPDLSKGVYKYRSTESGDPPTDADLWRSITRGVPYTRMTGFKFLAARDRWALVQYLKSISDIFDDEDPPEAIKIPKPIKGSVKAVQQGEAWYLLGRCFDCHGSRGRGDGPLGKGLRDAQGRVLRPANLASGRFKSGKRAQDIYRTLVTGLDGTPMAAYGEGTLLFSRESQAFKDEKSGKIRYPALEGAAPLYKKVVIDRVRAVIDRLPSVKELDKMSELDKGKVEATRRWQLIQYIQSLKKVGKE